MKLLRSLALLAVLPVLASASVITSGTITLRGVLPSGRFDLSGSDFTVAGTFIGGFLDVSCTGCHDVGSLMHVDAFVVGNAFNVFGTATIGGTNFTDLEFGGLNAGGPSIFDVAGPAIPLTTGAGTYYGTFTFHGSLCGTETSPHHGPNCLVEFPDLTGSGIIMVNIIAEPEGTLTYRGATYTFTPEPGTWMLVSGGIAGILAVRRRRLTKS